MPGPKTNEREGTRAVLHWADVSAFKAREVLDLVRGRPVHEAEDLLRFVERDCAMLVHKLLRSAVANAQNNEGLDPDELYISACFADEGPTAKRWRPRARGRATRIRKRSCHLTVIVSRMPEEQLARLQARRRAENLAMRARRVEATRRARAEAASAEAGEGASRRQRRHPEAFAVTEEAAAEEAAAGSAVTGAAAESAVAEEAAAEGAAGEEPAPKQAAEEAAEPEAQSVEGAAERSQSPAAAGDQASGEDQEEGEKSS